MAVSLGGFSRSILHSGLGCITARSWTGIRAFESRTSISALKWLDGAIVLSKSVRRLTPQGCAHRVLLNPRLRPRGFSTDTTIRHPTPLPLPSHPFPPHLPSQPLLQLLQQRFALTNKLSERIILVIQLLLPLGYPSRRVGSEGDKELGSGGVFGGGGCVGEGAVGVGLVRRFWIWEGSAIWIEWKEAGRRRCS